MKRILRLFLLWSFLCLTVMEATEVEAATAATKITDEATAVTETPDEATQATETTEAETVIIRVTEIAEADKAPEKEVKNELKIKDVFRIYGKRKNVVMVELSEEMLETYNITYYKSITIKNDPEALSFVRKCLEKDQDGAKKIKEVMSDGKIISAYYQIPVEKSSVNRFILFKVDKKGTITLIYIEGELDSDDLITILFTKKDL